MVQKGVGDCVLLSCILLHGGFWPYHLLVAEALAAHSPSLYLHLGVAEPTCCHCGSTEPG